MLKNIMVVKVGVFLKQFKEYYKNVLLIKLVLMSWLICLLKIGRFGGLKIMMLIFLMVMGITCNYHQKKNKLIIIIIEHGGNEKYKLILL